MVLFDTNLLVHAHAGRSPYHEVARRLRDEVIHGKMEACLSPQVLCEFFAVSTDERILQPPLTPEQANKEILNYWVSNFRKILPKENTVKRLHQLLERRTVKHQQVFDVFLVATMLDDEVRMIYTQNTKDFEVYPE